MDIIFQNPFRVLGLSVNATDREIAKQIDDLSIYTEMGKAIEYGSDNFFSAKPVRTPESIQEAKQKIDQPNSKLFYASFWFWEDSNNVNGGNISLKIDKCDAHKIWEKICVLLISNNLSTKPLGAKV